MIQTCRFVRLRPLTRLYSIKINPVNVSTTPPLIPLTKPTTLAQALYVYKENFPNETSNKIDKYENLTKNPRSTIKIGLLYDDRDTASHSKVLDSILADPLALGNKVWFEEKVVNRSRKLIMFTDTGRRTSHQA